MTGTDGHDVRGSVSAGVDHRGFWKVLDRFAGTLVDRYDLDDVLRALAADIRDVLDVVGAGIMLADDDGDLHFASTSDEVLGRLEALQIELDEGPCLLAYRTGQTVLAADLDDDDRFRKFGPRAVEAGMGAVFSFPMQVEQQVFGALNLYQHQAARFSDDQIEAGQTFANVATSYLMNASSVDQQHALTAQLQRALDSRVVIEQAKGFVCARLGVALVDAFELIRGHARRNQRTVRDVARDLLHGDLDVDELLGS